MTNSEFQKRLYSVIQQLNFNDEYKFINKLKKGGQIKDSNKDMEIKDENKGKFTASAKAAGQSVQEHAKSVLNNPNSTELQRKRAQFAANAAKWKHQNGGAIQKMQTAGTVLPPALAGMNYANAKRYWEALGDMDARQKAGILGNIYVESKMDPAAENASYKGLTQLGKQPLKAGIPARYSWVVKHYGSGGDNELRYVIDYVNGKLVKDSTFGYGSRPYRAGHARTYTVDDSTNLFRKWYEGTTDKSAERREAARQIYKLFNKQSEPKPEPQLEVQPLSSIQTVPIVEQPDVTLVAKPIPSFQLR